MPPHHGGPGIRPTAKHRNRIKARLRFRYRNPACHFLRFWKVFGRSRVPGPLVLVRTWPVSAAELGRQSRAAVSRLCPGRACVAEQLLDFPAGVERQGIHLAATADLPAPATREIRILDARWKPPPAIMASRSATPEEIRSSKALWSSPSEHPGLTAGRGRSPSGGRRGPSSGGGPRGGGGARRSRAASRGIVLPAGAGEADGDLLDDPAGARARGGGCGRRGRGPRRRCG